MAILNYAPRWFYHHIAHGEVASGSAICAVCGLSADPAGMTPKHKVLRPTFVDYDLQARAEISDVCPACVWYFDHQELLRSHWYLTPTEARPLAKADIVPLLAEHVAQPPREDRYYLIAFSKKKHIALRARLNAAGASRLRVNAETLLVDVDRGFFGLLDHLTTLRQYHAWQEIENDAYLPFAILRWPNLAEFEHRRAAVRPWLRSPAYHLARYLYSPPNKERDDEQLELSE